MRLRDLHKDDRIFFSMAVNGARVGGTEAIMQVVRIRLDGDYMDPLINMYPWEMTPKVPRVALRIN